MRCKYSGYSGCGGPPTKGAVNIGDIAGVSGGQYTKGAVNTGDITAPLVVCPPHTRYVPYIYIAFSGLPTRPTMFPIFTAPLVGCLPLTSTISPIFTAPLVGCPPGPLCPLYLQRLWPGSGGGHPGQGVGCLPLTSTISPILLRL